MDWRNASADDSDEMERDEATSESGHSDDADTTSESDDGDVSSSSEDSFDLSQIQSIHGFLVKPKARQIVFVYDLPMRNFSKEDLFRLFSPFGPIKRCEACWEEMPADPICFYYHFGYITYFSEVSAWNAGKALNEKIVNGQKIHAWQLFDFS